MFRTRSFRKPASRPAPTPADKLRRAVSAIESLECRRLLSISPPAPIIPGPGEGNLLEVAKRHEQKLNLNALDHAPIPFAIVAQAGSGTPVVAANNGHTGSAVRVNVDNNAATGPGGYDIEVEVNTELFLGGSFNPHLLMDINRLGGAPYASDFQVLIAFPFEAFNAEALGGAAPNLFVGYKTTGFASPETAGGIAPVSEQIRFIPNTVAGDDHEIEIQLNTVGASNPLQFITGHFDGTNLTGALNADAYAAWVQEPPANVTIGLDVDNSDTTTPGLPINGSFGLTWDASSASKVTFDYLEREAGADLSSSDYDTRVTFDKMPTQEELLIHMDEAEETLTLSHRANAIVDAIQIESNRSDGLKIIGTLSDVPLEVDLTLGLEGSVDLDVSANTLDLKLEAIKEDGFLDTGDFLGYPVGYAAVEVVNAPDLSADFLFGTDSFSVQATNPGESIGSIGLIIGDDDELELPPEQDELGGIAPWDDPGRHIFSLIDDGTHGTAAARLVNVQAASLNLNAADIAQVFTLTLSEAAPFTMYLRTTEESELIPDHDVEITANIHDMPAGQTSFTLEAPYGISYTTNPPQGIASVHVYGHIDSTYFDVIAGNLPAVFSFAFDPDGSLSVRADDGDGVPEPASSGDQIGTLGVVVSDADAADGLSGAAKELFGAPVRHAAFRVDEIPSFDATWVDDAGHTNVTFNTVETDAYLGGVQVDVSTEPATLPLQQLSAADVGSAHYLRFEDEGGSGNKRLAAGAFRIDNFAYDSNDAAHTYTLSYEGDTARALIAEFDSAFGGRYFPQFDTDLTLSINSVPASFEFASDLTTQFAYTGSGPISAITAAGVVDDTNDSVNNGAEVTFGMLGLPSQVRFGIITDEVRIIDGRLDVNGNDGIGLDDDGMLAGALILDGFVDVSGDGAISAADDGSFMGIGVIDGALNVDGNGAVDGSDDGAVAGAEARANGGINEVGFKLESVDNARGLFGKDYRLVQALANDVPAQFVLSYGGSRFLLETKDAAGNQDGLEQISALVSTSKLSADNNAKALPFTLDGPAQTGAILGDPAVVGTGAGGSRINYSPFLQEIDKRYYNSGVSPVPSDVLQRLAELYADSEQLDSGEDHLLVRMENLDGSGGDEKVGFASFEFNDFQRASWTPDADGGQFIFRAPGRGDDSFFTGYESDNEYTTFQIEHVPDEVIVDFDRTEHLTYDATASLGELDFYQGPGHDTNGLFAADNQSATRALMRNAPEDVRILWDFSFPNGGAIMDASNEFELLFLTQDGSTRMTAGLTLEDLHVGYGLDLFSFDITDDITIPIPFVDDIVIPTAWELFQAKAGIDNDADGLTLANLGDVNEIGGTDSKADVAGFFSMYNLKNSPAPLVNPAGPAPAASEYVPFINLMAAGFQEFSMEFLIELDPLNPGADLFPIDLEGNMNMSKVGDLVFDVWSSANTDFTDEDAIPLIPEVGFVNPPDYTDNTPFHILPGLSTDLGTFVANGVKGIHTVRGWVVTFDGWHAFDDHFDPFDGSPAPFTGSSGNGGFTGGDPGFIISALGAFSGALDRWETALEASGMDPTTAAGLITDLSNNTEIVVATLANPILGTATGTVSGATITVDPDAGGSTWYFDPTPLDDAEYEGGGPAPADLLADAGEGAQGKVDLLTFFAHEIGHILGYGHATEGVMQNELTVGVRRLPVAADASGDPPGEPDGVGDDVLALTLRTDDEEQEPDLLA